MKFTGFTATPDLMGRRIRLTWGWTLDPLETPGQVPDVVLRRKTRDFAFPSLVVLDPYLIHDSATFPPAPILNVLAVTDLPDRSTQAGGLVARISAISVARGPVGSSLEFTRRSETIWRDGAGRAVRVEVGLLDADSLTPGVLYYYEIDDGSAPGPEAIAVYRSIARAGEVWGLNRRLWDLLPEGYKGADPVQMPPGATVPGIPEAGRAGGQLKRFIDTFGMGLDSLRNGAEGLRALRDVETTTPAALAALGRQIGWDVAPALPLEQSRNEVETATRLFALGGTVQAMRAMVTHQTGWRAQVAEMAQNLVRAGVPGQGHLRVSVERPAVPGTFTGGLDGSVLFGFSSAGAFGGPGVPALLVAAVAGPYALWPGVELTLSVNGAAPTRIVFGPDDFADMTAATAAEIAVVLERHFDSLTAFAQLGALAIQTLLDTADASLRVEVARESLLALSDSPVGRIAVMNDASRPRLFYAIREERPTAGQATEVLHRLVTKAWGFGEWRDARGLPDWADGASEAAAVPDAGGIWLGIGRGGRRLTLARGLGQATEPARLSTTRVGPFALLAGQRLTVVTELGPESFLVNPADYASLAAATAPEIAAAINAQLVNVVATVLPDGVLRLTTVAVGDPARLSVDLANSTIARRLGLAARGLLARGGWDDAVGWQALESGPCVWGEVRSPTAAAYGGGVVLGWAEHQDGAWQVRTAKWRNLVAVASPNGVAEGIAGGVWTVSTTVDGLPSNTVRAVVSDARGVLAAATDAGLGLRRTGGPWVTITTVAGLPSNDLRALAVLPDGVLAIATAAGLAEVSPAGAVTATVASATGLLDDDLRCVAATPSGDLWIGSGGGLSRRDRFGQWSRWTVADGLPAGPVQCVAVVDGGPIFAGSALGLAVLGGTVWRGVGGDAGLPAIDIRALTVMGDGTLLAAAAGGFARLGPGAVRWSWTSPAEGLPITDCQAVTMGPSNRVLVGGPAGLAVSMPGGAGPWALTAGLPAGGINGVEGPWSVGLVLTAPPGGAEAPHLAATADGRLWLGYAARDAAVAAERDSWTLRLRRFDPATALWPGEQVLTAALPGGSSDQTAFALPQAAGGARLFFATDRSGGRGLAEVAINALGVAAAPVLFPLDSAEGWTPAALTMAGGEVWLFHRGDRPFSLSQSATLPPAGSGRRRSLRLADAATLYSPAGLRTPVLAHLPRHALRQHLGDPMQYTPDWPELGGGLPGDPVPLNTRRTVVLHLSPAPFGLPPTQERLQRLIQLLNRFKPINTRLRLVIRPEPLVEVVYPTGADIGEVWADDLPVIEAFGAVGEAVAIAYPGLGILLAHDINSLSALFADPVTFRRRTWFPDLI